MYLNWSTYFGYVIKSGKVGNIIGGLLWLLPFLGAGQTADIKRPIGMFQQDSVKIGESVQFSFYSQHPATAEVIFPDSTYNFSPFELVARQFFPTRTKGATSLDSIVYTLRTFSVEPVQFLSIPIFILAKNDTIQISSRPDKINLVQLVRDKVSPENLKNSTELAHIKERFNSTYWLIGAAVFLLILIFVWLLFGKRIIIRYRLYTLQKQHTQFINRFNTYIDQFNQSESLQTIEQAITLWKNYLTDLEGNAINSFTTREVATFYNDDEDVTTALRLFDKAIYGNIVSDKSSETIIAFFLLHHFADRRYEVIRNLNRHVTSPENIPQLV